MAHNARLGDAMRELGWTRTKLRFGGGAPEWCYAKGDERERVVQLALVFEHDGAASVVDAARVPRRPTDDEAPY